jgi:eukaryotic-like serine/threonine-protein kinase
MAEVYRAVDRATGATVAVKLMRDVPAADADRFVVECRVLQQLRHPNIVGYVAHGRADDGLYLAMEWLSGEDLAARLKRGPLGVSEALTLGRSVASALASAHARAIIHRDIKPSNLFLVDGRVETVKVLDFGVARWGFASRVLTAAGMLVGTPAYMAPEQMRSSQSVDARVDLYALGGVLFHCLAGTTPFTADHAIALLAKVMFESPPSVSDLRSGIPVDVARLVDRLLAKDPTGRPRDAARLVDELAALEPMISDEALRAPRVAKTITNTELRVASIVLAPPRRSNDATQPGAGTPTIPDADPALAETMSAAVERTTSIEDVARQHGGRLHRLVDGTVIVFLTGGAANDLAEQAARCALELQPILPGRALAVATGATADSPVPVGEVIDRAAELLARNQSRSIFIDDVTAALIEGRHPLRPVAGGFEIAADLAPPDAIRTFLGHPTPCVGRDMELASLEAIFADCVDEAAPQVALIVAEAGAGKSRLRYELLRRLQVRAEQPEVWIGRGEPMSSGSPLALLSRAVIDSLGLQPGDSLRDRLRQTVAELFDGADEIRVCEFLCELLGLTDGDGSLQLQAARRDPALMADQVTRAWEDFVVGRAASRPIVLVLEDLHWGDAATVRLVDRALQLKARMMVLALARPELEQQMPDVWRGRALTRLHLRPLSTRSCEALVRSLLPTAPPIEIETIAARCQGNAFFLEELIRSAAEGRRTTPGTVIAMLQSRLEAFDATARRVLRAASIFGEAFWLEAVAALVGADEEETNAVLERLEIEEMIASRRRSRFAGRREIVFRHALVRDAAYATLTESDRMTGHRLAAAWLETAGERDAVVLAGHCERGGAALEGARHYHRAALDALAANDLTSAIMHAGKALELGVDVRLAANAQLVLAEAHTWRAEYERALTAAAEAIAGLPRSEHEWFTAVAFGGESAGRLGRTEDLFAMAKRALEPAVEQAAGARVKALAAVGRQLVLIGRRDLFAEIEPRLEWQRFELDDPQVAGRALESLASAALFDGDYAQYLELTSAAAERFRKAGDLRAEYAARGLAGYALVELGAYARARELLTQVLHNAERLGLGAVAASAHQNLTLACGHLADFPEAKAHGLQSIEAFRAARSRRMEATSRYYLALVRKLEGDLDSAERDARDAVQIATSPTQLPTIEAEGRAVLATILLAKQQNREALGEARRAFDLLQSLGGIDGGESLIRFVWAAALAASDDAGAASAFADAATRLRARANKILDQRLRESFLASVAENAQTLAQAARYRPR